MALNSVIVEDDKTTSAIKEVCSTRRICELTENLVPSQETERVRTRPALPIDYPMSKHQLDPDRSIDHVKKLKVAVIGAGISGITAGILLPAKVPGIRLVIFEKNSDVVCFHC